jgi:hypothetical protein
MKAKEKKTEKERSGGHTHNVLAVNMAFPSSKVESAFTQTLDCRHGPGAVVPLY